MSEIKTKGQILYEKDTKNKPLYHDGTKREGFHELKDYAKYSWEKGASKGVESDTF